MWREAEGIYQEILRLPFVRELSAGTLSMERFVFYIRQDSYYIENYSRVLAHIASRLPSIEWMESFLSFASCGILVENEMHESYAEIRSTPVQPTPTCLLYCAYESAQALGPVEVEAAAVLPCFWIYTLVGKEIHKKSSPDNPFARWIETYADESFVRSTERAIEICDALAAQATEDVRRRMTEAFVMATKMEWMFWDSAYNLEKWKV